MNLVKNHRTFADSIINDLFNRGVNEFLGSDFTHNYPAVNIHENNDSFTIALAAPGLSKEDFQIHLDKKELIVSAKKEAAATTEESTKYTRREFNYANFKRSFTLPETVDSESINASYDNGVLNVVLPKKAEVVIAPDRKSVV